jgi:protein PsiE
MLETMRRLGTATSSLHRGVKDTVDTFGALLVDAFHYLSLFAIGATTVWSAAAAFVGMVAQGRASLGDYSSCSFISKLERWSEFISRRRACRCGT